MSNVLPIRKFAPISSPVEPGPLAEQVLALLRTVYLGLPDDERALLVSELLKIVGPTLPPARPLDLLTSIRMMLAERDRFTIAEVKQQVDASGVSAAPKEIYNAIGHLARQGLVRRVGYGRYMVNGMELVTADDFGGATTRYEDEYRTSRDNEPKGAASES